MQDPLLDPLRQRILARMGIPLWQQRGRLLAGGTSPDGAAQPANTPADEVLAPQETAPLPTGKLWLLAETLPAPSLLGDICRWLGLATDEVSLLSEMPSLPAGGALPLLWLTAPDPRWPDALVCPLKPDGAHKRALWQQCRQRHTP
ncbi:hypothetical protein ACK31U_15625 [Aeromonas caviae]|uniref:hypothetical protein n=1 Tax=Aeromonas caviae TaxID=648 RepID=UPI002B47BCB8|nr:hypothetical protein [Aeromonas caviae]